MSVLRGLEAISLGSFIIHNLDTCASNEIGQCQFTNMVEKLNPKGTIYTYLSDEIKRAQSQSMSCRYESTHVETPRHPQLPYLYHLRHALDRWLRWYYHYILHGYWSIHTAHDASERKWGQPEPQ